jgi:hypothetical protein
MTDIQSYHSDSYDFFNFGTSNANTYIQSCYSDSYESRYIICFRMVKTWTDFFIYMQA